MEIRPTYLVMCSAQNNNKYYNLFPEGDKVRVEYGRIDATKTTTYYPISKFESQVKAKLKKGYQDVTDLKKDLVEEISSTSPESPYSSKGHYWSGCRNGHRFIGWQRCVGW